MLPRRPAWSFIAIALSVHLAAAIVVGLPMSLMYRQFIKLQTTGISSTAVVLLKDHRGRGAGQPFLKYAFEATDGESSARTTLTGTSDINDAQYDAINKGDSIPILYLKSNPDVNSSNEFDWIHRTNFKSKIWNGIFPWIAFIGTSFIATLIIGSFQPEARKPRSLILSKNED